MTINAPAACLLLLYELVGEEQGVPSEKLRGTTQNDVLKEYIARGNYIYPPAPTMRLTTDIFEYCHERVPRWNTISISGYHFREKGCSAVQEVAFTLCSGIAYVQAAIDKGLVGRRVRAAPGVLLQRPQQRLPGGRQVPRGAAHVGAHHARALRRHEPEGDDAPLPHPDRRRDADRPAAGEQHRARGPAGLRRRVRRHPVAAHQRLRRGAGPAHRARREDRAAHPADPRRTSPGAADTVDPFAGSYFVESLTDEIEPRAQELIAKVDALGGSVNAIEFITGEIDESAWGYQERYRIGQDIVVGVNDYEEEDIEVPDLLRVDPESEREQLERLAEFKADRDQALVARRLDELREVAARHREPAARDPPGAAGPLLAGGGLRGDAGRVRQVRADLLIRRSLRAASLPAVAFSKSSSPCTSWPWSSRSA